MVGFVVSVVETGTLLCTGGLESGHVRDKSTEITISNKKKFFFKEAELLTGAKPFQKGMSLAS